QVVDVGGREVYFRFAGDGPPFLLLHESPRSSVALIPLMERLADDFTVVGLDTPGIGGSYPLEQARPRSDDYADAVVDTMIALGLEKVPIYGTHTGACIAAALAARHPGRVAIAILDGYPIFTRAEQEELLREYLPPFRPAWNGTHVAWLWARVRDQFTFFPWYAAGREGRLPRDPPPLDFHQLVVEDFLHAGDNYRPAYASAFRFDGVKALDDFRAPVAITAREDDLLFPHLDRLPETLPKGVEVHRLGADRDEWAARIGDIAKREVVQQEMPAPEPEWTCGKRMARRFVEVNGRTAHVRRGGTATGRPLLLLHRTPGHGGELDDQVKRLARSRTVIAPDLPGSGNSDGLDGMNAASVIDWVECLLSALDIDECDVAGEYTGGSFALQLAALGNVKAKTVTLAQMSRHVTEAAPKMPPLPDLTPRWDGTHLMAAWYWARDSILYKDWCDRRVDAAWPVIYDTDIGLLHARFAGAVFGAKSHARLHAAAQEISFDEAIGTVSSAGTRISRTDLPLAAYRWEEGM
ncbi:MAG: alpha/beta fold hydrolase, partial [Pseudomonadota bacterium]